MTHFRLPRKIKKSLRKDIWLYPADEKGNSLMAMPRRNQADYDAYKQGKVRGISTSSSKKERKEWNAQLNYENTVSDEELRRYVNEIIREDLRISSYNTLLKAKTHPQAKVAYYNFVNAFQQMEAGDDSMGNICCMAIDSAQAKLKKKKKK